MKKGVIEKLFTGELCIVYVENIENGKHLHQQLRIHPYYKHYLFQVNQEVKFEYAHECLIHYPEFCDCFKKELFALPILKSDKITYFVIIKKIMKRLKLWLTAH